MISGRKWQRYSMLQFNLQTYKNFDICFFFYYSYRKDLQSIRGFLYTVTIDKVSVKHRSLSVFGVLVLVIILRIKRNPYIHHIASDKA